MVLVNLGEGGLEVEALSASHQAISTLVNSVVETSAHRLLTTSGAAAGGVAGLLDVTSCRGHWNLRNCDNRLAMAGSYSDCRD